MEDEDDEVILVETVMGNEEKTRNKSRPSSNNTFILDVNGEETTSNERSASSSSLKRQHSEASMSGILGAVETTIDKGKGDRPRRSQQCFNCSGDHMISECSEPRNGARIRMNSLAFRQQQAQRPLDNGRYHAPNSERISSSSSRSNFLPGRLSKNLLNALGMEQNDVPEWIYRMRRFGFEKGYPPGYLKMAMVNEKNKNGDDQRVIFHDEQEETEEQEEGIISTVVLDPEKIIRYYGFNAAHRNLNDREYRQYSAPPFEEFVAFLSAAIANRPPPIVEKRQHPKDHLTDRINGEKRMRHDDETTIDPNQSSDVICLDTTTSSHDTGESSEILSCPASPGIAVLHQCLSIQMSRYQRWREDVQLPYPMALLYCPDAVHSPNYPTQKKRTITRNHRCHNSARGLFHSRHKKRTHPIAVSFKG